MAAAVVNAGVVPLTDRDRAILDYERAWWHDDRPKEAAIRERFAMSASRYYQLLNEVVDSPDALAHDPLLVRRLRRERGRRRRTRLMGRSAPGADER